MKRLLLIPVVVFSITQGWSQNRPTVSRDTIIIEAQDSALLATYARRYDPRRSLLLAAVVPGMGQIYNKKYWKIPLVYGGFYAIGRGIMYYDDIYSSYRAHLYYNLENGLQGQNGVNPATQLRTGQLRRIVDRARRERDFMVILMGGMYILQIVDAHVDSHLKEFDLNPNLRVSVEPTFEYNAMLGRQSGMAFIIRF